jgi:hypothetical protein
MSDATKPLDPLAAARNADWQQVALNGGPPCFYLEDDNRFCLRAERWAGHDGSPHSFISLAMLLADREAKLAERDTELARINAINVKLCADWNGNLRAGSIWQDRAEAAEAKLREVEAAVADIPLDPNQNLHGLVVAEVQRILTRPSTRTAQ